MDDRVREMKYGHLRNPLRWISTLNPYLIE